MTIFVSMEPPGPTPPGTHVSSCLTPLGGGYHNPLSNPYGEQTPQPNTLTPAGGNLT